MPIGGNPMAADDTSAATNIMPTTIISPTNPPKAGTVLGVAIKGDIGGEPTNTQDPEITQSNTDDQNEKNNAKPTVKEDD